MSAVAVEEKPNVVLLRTLGFADRACSVCGWRFFTSAALYDHSLTCRPPKRISAALRQAGLRVAALNNSRRRQCNECGLTSTLAALGYHQKHAGHSGYTDVS